MNFEDKYVLSCIGLVVLIFMFWFVIVALTEIKILNMYKEINQNLDYTSKLLDKDTSSVVNNIDRRSSSILNKIPN